MADNEQELLSPEDIMAVKMPYPFVEGTKLSIKDIKAMGKAIAEAQVAKLKAQGYERVWTKCPKCDGDGTIPVDTPFSDSLPSADCPICKGTGKITFKVEWDREKVAEAYLQWKKNDTTIQLGDITHSLRSECFEYADQLKKELTK